MVLTREELEGVTGKSERAQKRYGYQATELDHLGIPYLRRYDGTLIVFKRHLKNGQTKKAAEASPTLRL
jgi:hypothetical protein